MSQAQDLTRTSRQRLEQEWAQAREGWNDGTTVYFAGHFWAPLQDELKAYEQALDLLIETLTELH